MGMNSPELLRLVENCPKGAETLVTRIIHILTDKGSSQLLSLSALGDLFVLSRAFPGAGGACQGPLPQAGLGRAFPDSCSERPFQERSGRRSA